MLFEKIEWTTDLGQAFLNQPRDVLSAIQTQRYTAKLKGDLESNEQQKVSTTEIPGSGTVIVIQPANPEVIYVPTTTVVSTSSDNYNSSSALVPLATFGVGLALGMAINDDDNDYYYGGGGGGPSYWYGNSNVDKWQDNRRAVWEDHNDRAWDRQDHRQDMSGNRQDFRQDMYEQGKYPNQAQRDQNRSQAKQNATNRRSEVQQGARSTSAERDQYKQNVKSKVPDASSKRSSVNLAPIPLVVGALDRLAIALELKAAQDSVATARKHQHLPGVVVARRVGLRPVFPDQVVGCEVGAEWDVVVAVVEGVSAT